MVNRDIITNFSRFTDNHTGAMVDKEAPADRRRRVNLDLGHKPTEVAK